MCNFIGREPKTTMADKCRPWNLWVKLGIEISFNGLKESGFKRSELTANMLHIKRSICRLWCIPLVIVTKTKDLKLFTKFSIWSFHSPPPSLGIFSNMNSGRLWLRIERDRDGSDRLDSKCNYTRDRQDENKTKGEHERGFRYGLG